MKKPMRNRKLPTYEKVTSYLKQNPNASVLEALDRTKSSSGTYYTQKRAALGTTRKPKFEKLLPTAEAANGPTKKPSQNSGRS